MRKVIIRTEVLRSGLERFRTVWKTGKFQGESITFESEEVMLKTLTSKRWQVVNVLLAHGPISVRAMARRLGRDVKNVDTDVTALKAIGLVEDHEAGIWVPFDEIDFILSASRKAG